VDLSKNKTMRFLSVVVTSKGNLVFMDIVGDFVENELEHKARRVLRA
jgi:hypothetical protein